MFRHGWRRLPLISFEADTDKSIKLPRDRMIKCINLEFDAVDVISGGLASGVVLDDAVQRLIKQIEVVGNGSVTLFRMAGRDLHFKNHNEYGTLPSITQPASGDEASHTLMANLMIDFGNNIGVRPPDTNLPAMLFKSLELIIDWANPVDMFDTDHDRDNAIADSYGIRPVIFETNEPIPNSMRIQDFRDDIVSATQPEFVLDFTVGDRIYQVFMLRTTHTPTKKNYVRNNAIVNFIDLTTDSKTYHLKTIPFDQQQHINKLLSSYETVNAGIIYLYLLEDGRIISGLNTFDTNTCKMVLDVTVGTGVTAIRTIYDYICPIQNVLG